VKRCSAQNGMSASPPMQLHRRAKVSGVQNCRRCCRITPRTAKPMGYAMNVRRGLFRFRSLFRLGGPLLWKADNLVQIAGLHAVAMFETLLREFSFLREADVKQWDFSLTIAGVLIAVTRLVDLGLRGNRQRKRLRKGGAKLTQWDPTNGRRAFEDCASFYGGTFDELTS